uniref:TLC domain-containing protein n=1 Tax=Coccolithus braarudii TaxID=221442 RepID=A0A7S0Q245_9EUKA
MYVLIFFASRTFAPLLFAGAAKLDSPTLSYWGSSLASVVNCFVVVPMAWIACGQGDLLAVDAGLSVTTPLSTTACYAMVGYTFFDLLPMLYHRKHKTWSGGVSMYLVHHVCSLLTWGLAAAEGHTHSIVVPVLLLETTGPFVNLRWFLSTHGLKESWLYIINGLVMFVSFFLLRVVFNWWIFFNRIALRTEDMLKLPTHLMVLTYILYPINLGLQLLWFQKILSGVLALLSGKSKKKSK